MATLSYLLTVILAVSASVSASQLDRRMGSVVTTNCRHDFAYTFDDGPYLWTDEIIDEFDCAGAKTTLFVNGNHNSCIYSEDNVQKLRYAFESGHQIAAHTWSNADMSTLTQAQIDVEIKRLDEALIKILGVRPKVFRPPNSLISDSNAAYIVNTYGKRVVTTEVSSGDAASGATAQGVFSFYQSLAKEGTSQPHLVQAHETQSIALDAMDLGSVTALTSAGIKLVTVAQCLDIAAYEVVGGYGLRDASWTCDGTWTAATKPATCSQTYTSTASEKTCAALGTKFGLTGQDILFANPYLNCEDVWAGTPICVPKAATSTTPATCSQTYTSVKGDTCTNLAEKFATTSEKIFESNKFLTCSDIWAGTPLCIPGSSTAVTCSSKYTSVAGDTCASIAAMFKLSSGDAIKNANSFVTCTDIWANTPICIPPGGSSCASTYTAGDKETCLTVAGKFGVTATAVYNANTFVSCDDIWKGTPLCIPPGGRACSNTITSWPGATCKTIASAYTTTEDNIKLWNSFLNCDDIWTNTPVCVAH